MTTIPPFMPMVNCVMGALVAAAVMAGLVRFTGEKAWRIFLLVSIIVFGIFFMLPISMLRGDTTSILFLEVMHIPAVFGIVAGIGRFSRS